MLDEQGENNIAMRVMVPHAKYPEFMQYWNSFAKVESPLPRLPKILVTGSHPADVACSNAQEELQVGRFYPDLVAHRWVCSCGKPFNARKVIFVNCKVSMCVMVDGKSFSKGSEHQFEDVCEKQEVLLPTIADVGYINAWHLDTAQRHDGRLPRRPLN